MLLLRPHHDIKLEWYSKLGPNSPLLAGLFSFCTPISRGIGITALKIKRTLVRKLVVVSAEKYFTPE